MEKLMNIIIIVIIVTIIIILGMIGIININKEDGNNNIVKEKIDIQNQINNKYLNTETEANKFEFMEVSDQTMSIKYLLDYKEKALYDVNVAYNLLDKEYKQKRFGNVEEYKKYIERHKEKLQNAILKQYQYKEYKNYNQYILIDQYNNYYIIRETGTMQYTIILDTYTIDLPEYIEKYNKANEQQKTAYNINRFFQAINDENYTFAYSMLATGFKNNYFKTEASFENYIKQNSMNNKKVEFKQFNNEGNVYYTYKVLLLNGEQDTSPIEKNFIVKLGEGTKFELSFNVD